MNDRPPAMALDDNPRSAFAFAIRTTAAALLALAIAGILAASQPWWAAMTVWLVAQPTRALLVERAVARLGGTAIGAVMGAALLAMPLDWPGKLIALGLWLALCAGAGSQFRHFRTYAFVLAGYTASIVLMTGWSVSETPGALAVDRLLCTAVGIVTATALSALGLPAAHRYDVPARLHGLHGAVRDRAHEALRGARIADAKTLIVSLADLERDIDESIAGSMRERGAALRARRMIGVLLELIALAPAAGSVAPAGRRAIVHALVDLKTLAARPPASFGVGELAAERDPFAFLRTAARPALALAIAVAIWCVTGAREGPVVVITATLFATLFSSHSQGNIALSHVLVGTIGGALMGGAVRLLVLPAVTTLAGVFLALAPTLLAGAWLMRRARTAKLAIDVNMTFLLIAQPLGPPSTPVDTMRLCVAVILGVVVTLVTYRVFVPASDDVQQQRAAGRVARFHHAIAAGRAGDAALQAMRAAVVQLMAAGGVSDALTLSLRSLADAVVRVRGDAGQNR